MQSLVWRLQSLVYNTLRWLEKQRMLTAWMGKNSDFIHSYVPWMSFHRDRFKYHLKYKEKVFLKRKTALVIWPVTTFHSFSNVWYIQGILTLITKGYLCSTAWKRILKTENLFDTENKVRATLIRISENYVQLPFGKAKKYPMLTHTLYSLCTILRTSDVESFGTLLQLACLRKL